jgi:hypothetical protein
MFKGLKTVYKIMKLLTFIVSIICAQSFSKESMLIKNNKPSIKSFDFVGDTAPTGFFDPLNLTQNLDESAIKYLRESELHHGRIAMTSIVLLPLIDNQSDNLAINTISSLPVSAWDTIRIRF